jgi:hypothetical protein
MAWLPRLSALVENVAVPAASVPVPSVVLPSLKVTVPVGDDPPDPLTVAVKVMDWPKALGLAEELSAVVEEAWLTVCVSAAEVLAS